MLAELLSTVGRKAARNQTELAALAATAFNTPTLSDRQLIGEGGFAMVHSAKLNGSGQTAQVAVKSMRQALPFSAFLVEANMWAAEVLVMRRASHPNVLKCLGWDIIEEEQAAAPNTGLQQRLFRMRILMPLMAGSLESLAKDPAVEPDRLLRLFCQASAGLRHLHDDLRVLHNDVKAANILLDQQGNAVVADFGLACSLTSGSNSVPDPRGHTKGYTAPERQGCASASVLAPKGCQAFACPASDVWALALELARLYRRVPAAHRPDGDPHRAPEFVRQLLAACMARQPELRMSAGELESALCMWIDTRRLPASRLVAAAFARACSAGAAVCELSVCLDALSTLGSVAAVSTIMFSSDADSGSSGDASSWVNEGGCGDDDDAYVDDDGNNDELADLNNFVGCGSDTDYSPTVGHSSGSDVSSSGCSSLNDAVSRRSPLPPSRLVVGLDACLARKHRNGLSLKAAAV